MFTLFALSAVLATTQAPPATQVIEQDGVRLEYSSLVPEADVIYALGQAIYARTVASRFLNREPPAVLHVMLVDEERIPYTDAQRRFWVPYGRLRDREPGVDPLTILHETTHVLASAPGRADRALTEGLAVYVQTRMGARAYPNFGADLHRTTVDLQARYGREVPWTESEAVRKAQESGPGRVLAYVQEGSFVRWLIEDNGGMETFLKLLDGGSAETLYGHDMVELEAQWRAMLNALPPVPASGANR